jgi:hypothetical protein
MGGRGFERDSHDFFSCAHCQKTLKVKDELAGKRIRCPTCKHPQEVPSVTFAEWLGFSPALCIAAPAR